MQHHKTITPKPGEKLWKIGEVAHIFSVSDQSIRNWGDRGIIPKPIRTACGHRRFTLAHIEAVERYLYPENFEDEVCRAE